MFRASEILLTRRLNNSGQMDSLVHSPPIGQMAQKEISNPFISSYNQVLCPGLRTNHLLLQFFEKLHVFLRSYFFEIWQKRRNGKILSRWTWFHVEIASQYRKWQRSSTLPVWVVERAFRVRDILIWFPQVWPHLKAVCVRSLEKELLIDLRSEHFAVQ